MEFDNLYFVSPNIGFPIAYNCFLNWCFRPVIGFNSNKLASEFLSITVKIVFAFSTIFLSKRDRLSSNLPAHLRTFSIQFKCLAHLTFKFNPIYRYFAVLGI